MKCFYFFLPLIFLNFLLMAQDNRSNIRDVLVNNIWQYDSASNNSYSPFPVLLKFFENGDMIFICKRFKIGFF